MKTNRLLLPIAILTLCGCGASTPSLADLKATYDFEHGKIVELKSSINNLNSKSAEISGRKLHNKMETIKAQSRGNSPEAKALVQTCLDIEKIDAEEEEMVKGKLAELWTKWKKQYPHRAIGKRCV
jgi:hypothetical protein